MFGDDRYYEFMFFNVPKVVRSPGYDHGHDEESLNGRDINIDILEAYVWISEVFRVKSAFYRSTGRLRDSYWALMGHTGKERKASKGGRTLPMDWSELD